VPQHRRRLVIFDPGEEKRRAYGSSKSFGVRSASSARSSETRKAVRPMLSMSTIQVRSYR